MVTLASLRAQAAPNEFTQLADSPVPVTSVTVDPNTNIIYAQENQGTGFYSYNPVTNTWTTLASAPLNSGNNGGATYANGDIYTVYVQNDTQMGVYDIATNTWSVIANPLGDGTGNITSVGNVLYLMDDATFVSYDVITNITTSLAPPPFTFEGWGGLEPYNGYIYGHQANDFARYNIANNTWTTLPNIPAGAVQGSAIDPVNGIYIAYGGYDNNNVYTYYIADNQWYTTVNPLFSVQDGGMVYVSTPGYEGIYMVQGEIGTEFARFESSEIPPSTYNSSVNGSGTLANTGGKVKTSFFGAYNKNGLGGAVSWTDKINNINFKSTEVYSIVVNGNEATLYGVGTLNDISNVKFILTTRDNFPTFFGRGDYVSFELPLGYSFAGTFNPGDSKVTGG
jgi:hypothetical protein